MVLFALVLLGILLVFFALPPGEKAIKRVVEKRLGHLLAQEVRIGKLETNLFTHLEMRNLQIYKEQSGDTILLLDLGEAKVNYRLIDLLKKPPAIRSLYLEDLLLSVRKDSSGAYNIPLSEPAEKEDSVSHAALIPFVLGKAEVRGATLRYGDDISGLTVSAYDAGLTAEHGGGQTYAFHFRADSAEGRYREIPLTTWEIGLDGRFGTDQVRLDSMAMRHSWRRGLRAISPAGRVGESPGNVNRRRAEKRVRLTGSMNAQSHTDTTNAPGCRRTTIRPTPR